MLINLSNHPSTGWKDKQLDTAIAQYGTIQDIPFPNIPPTATAEAVQQLAITYVQQIQKLAQDEANQPFAAHIMGEMTFTFRVVQLLRQSGIYSIASTTKRDTIEHQDGSKTFKFNFVQFRAYS